MLGSRRLMPTWRALLKLTAFVLLLGAAIDIFVVDLVVPGSCDDAAPQSSSGSQADHDCFCCCAHLVLTRTHQVEPSRVSEREDIATLRLFLSGDPGGIDHPPRI
jgi:hypothetical protein